MHMLNKTSLTFTNELFFINISLLQLVTLHLHVIIQKFGFTYIYCITNLQIDINIIPYSIAVPKLYYFS